MRIVKPMHRRGAHDDRRRHSAARACSTIRHCGTPSAIAASMKVSFFKVRTSADADRANHGQVVDR